MWEHFFTHENTVPHSYNTGLMIHTNYPHPHAAVSIILLLFLSLLLHNVFSQKSSDNNCTITDGPFHIPRVPRIGCTAQSCFSCNQTKAECFHNTTSNTFTCATNTSTSSVQLCDPCQYCVGTFSTSTTSQNFTLHSQFIPASDMPGSNH